MKWEKVCIGDYVSLRQGFAINKNTKHHISDEPTELHLLRIADMKDGSKNVFVKDTIPKTFLANPEDIIYTRTGQVGLVFKNQFGVIHNNCFTVTPIDDNLLCRQYLFYALQNIEFFTEANSLATGAAQPDLPHGAFKSIKIYLPPISTQHRIAYILSAYDELIENNQKQIKLLEKAAQRLYKEWFVDLRFPGYEDVKTVDGVPEGWKIGSITEISICYDKKRKPLSSKQRENQKKIYPYYGAASQMDYVGNYIFDGVYLLFGEDGTVITSGNTPVLQYVWGKFWVNNHAHIFQGDNGYSTEFLYMLCKHMKVSDIVTGVAQPKISQGRLNDKKIMIPPVNLAAEFKTKIETSFNKIRTLNDSIVLLKESRDRLLPKLMSGELEV